MKCEGNNSATRGKQASLEVSCVSRWWWQSPVAEYWASEVSQAGGIWQPEYQASLEAIQVAGG